MPGLEVAASTATIGSFAISGIGLSHLLKDSFKHPSIIIEEAQNELSDALAILNTFHGIIHDDCLTPLFNKYEM
jgi:hypothetical protein